MKYVALIAVEVEAHDAEDAAKQAAGLTKDSVVGVYGIGSDGTVADRLSLRGVRVLVDDASGLKFDYPDEPLFPKSLGRPVKAAA